MVLILAKAFFSSIYIWDKVFKNGLSKICGRQLLENLKEKGCLPQILLGSFLNTLSHLYKYWYWKLLSFGAQFHQKTKFMTYVRIWSILVPLIKFGTFHDVIKNLLIAAQLFLEFWKVIKLGCTDECLASVAWTCHNCACFITAKGKITSLFSKNIKRVFMKLKNKCCRFTILEIWNILEKWNVW